MKPNNDVSFRLLDMVIDEIGIFRTMQLLNEIEVNNWKLSKKFPPLRPRVIANLRSGCCEYRLSLKRGVQERLIQHTQLKLSA